MRATLKPSQNVGLAAVINPQSMAAGTYTSAWVPVSQAQWLMALIMIGTVSTGTIDAKLEQAQDNSGTGVKDLRVMTQKTTSSVQAVIQARADEVDLANGFGFVRLKITTAVAATICSGALFQLAVRYGPADRSGGVNSASLTEIVG